MVWSMLCLQRWMRAYGDYMQKNRYGGGKASGRGGKAIKSAVRMNIDLRAAVLSDVELLEAITTFQDTNESYFQQVPGPSIPRPKS